MNFGIHFHRSREFRRFKKSWGKGNALEMVHEIFGVFQMRRSNRIEIWHQEDIENLFDPRIVRDPNQLLEVAIETGFLEEVEECVYRSPPFENFNAELIANWI